MDWDSRAWEILQLSSSQSDGLGRGGEWEVGVGERGEGGGASPYLAELLLVLGHFLQHLGQVSHGGLWGRKHGVTRPNGAL